MTALGPDDEPQDSGALVAVHHGDYRRQEVWVRSGANIGNWYCLGGEFGRPKVWDDPRRWPDTLLWTGPAPQPGPREVRRHPTWRDIIARGPVTLLVAGQDEMRAAGWAAGRRQLLGQIEQLADEQEPGQ